MLLVVVVVCQILECGRRLARRRGNDPWRGATTKVKEVAQEAAVAASEREEEVGEEEDERKTVELR